jgi:hypothetical protein
MVTNRSVPTDILLPHISYRNLPEALPSPTHTFGFAEHYRYGDPISGGETAEESHSGGTGLRTQSLTVFVEDLHETDYGERQYGVRGLEGHHWLFSRHARDVNPEDWGAKVKKTI